MEEESVNGKPVQRREASGTDIASLSELYRFVFEAYRKAAMDGARSEECQAAATRAARRKMPFLSEKEANVLAARIITVTSELDPGRYRKPE
jgi:hypothetical protein